MSKRLNSILLALDYSDEISPIRLKLAMCTFGEKFSADEWKTCFAEAPLDSTGKIDLKKWARIICGGDAGKCGGRVSESEEKIVNSIIKLTSLSLSSDEEAAS